MNTDLTEKTAIVTGASGGIGRAVAITLAKAGANLVINYSSNEARAVDVKREIEAFGGAAVTCKADVTDISQCEALVQCAIEHFKGIDILINNAGITRDNLLARMKQEEWLEVIDTNLTGTYNCCKAVLRPLLKQKSGGSIVNIASVAGIHGNSGQINYSAAKGGVISLTRALAKEIGSRNITVNAVAPGFIETEMTEALPEKIRAQALSHIALGRFGLPEDVADTVLFLSASARYITGQVIVVDGSLTM